MKPPKQIVCLASTMRSGSTLLKALLAEANDVSNLPEMNFQRYSDRDNAIEQLGQLDSRSIILLKRPAWYTETNTYPRLPKIDDLKVVVLVRDVYDTVQSCRKMTFRFSERVVSPLADGWLARRYWLKISRSLRDLHEDQNVQTQLIRYEDLVSNPLEETQSLFEFIGSAHGQGVDSYSRPDDFKWRWGRDDGSPNIRSLKVQPPRQKAQSNRRLLRIIEETPEIVDIRKRLGYVGR